MSRACTSASVRPSVGTSASAPGPLRRSWSPSTSCLRMSISSHSSSMSASWTTSGRSTSYRHEHRGSINGTSLSAACAGAAAPAGGAAVAPKNCSKSCASSWPTRNRCSQPLRASSGSGCADSASTRCCTNGAMSASRAAQYRLCSSCSSRRYSGRPDRASISWNRPLRLGSAAARKRTYNSDTSVPSASTDTPATDAVACMGAAPVAALLLLLLLVALAAASLTAASTCVAADLSTACTLLRTAPMARACSCRNFAMYVLESAYCRRRGLSGVKLGAGRQAGARKGEGGGDSHVCACSSPGKYEWGMRRGGNGA
eukprot:361840-Chlamydomonas_euryale.AAC.12